MRGSLAVRWAHNPKAAGSNPAPCQNPKPSENGFFIPFRSMFQPGIVVGMISCEID